MIIILLKVPLAQLSAVTNHLKAGMEANVQCFPSPERGGESGLPSHLGNPAQLKRARRLWFFPFFLHSLSVLPHYSTVFSAYFFILFHLWFLTVSTVVSGKRKMRVTTRRRTQQNSHYHPRYTNHLHIENESKGITHGRLTRLYRSII